MCGGLDCGQPSHPYLKCFTIKYEVRVKHFFHIALLNDFESFASCMSDGSFDSAHSSTASPSLSVEVYPPSVVLLLTSRITI